MLLLRADAFDVGRYRLMPGDSCVLPNRSRGDASCIVQLLGSVIEASVDPSEAVVVEVPMNEPSGDGVIGE